MSDGEVFLVEVARPGRDAIGAPVDYATMRSDVTTLLGHPVIDTLGDVPDVVGSPNAGDVLVWNADDDEWQPMALADVFPLPYERQVSQNSADVASTTNSVDYQTVLTTTFSLPAGWAWTVRVKGDVLVSHSSGGSVVCAIATINSVGGTSLSAACPANPVRATIPVQAVQTGMTGSITVALGYRLNAADGTAYSGGGTVSIRLYPEF